MEVEPDLARATLDAINAFGDRERPCIWTTLLADVLLHPIIPHYDVLYTRGSGELWYYDEDGNFVLAILCKRGVRQGCVLSVQLRERRVHGSKPVKVADILTTSHGIYGDVSLSQGWGLKKTELVFPTDCDHEDLLIPRSL